MTVNQRGQQCRVKQTVSGAGNHLPRGNPLQRHATTTHMGQQRANQIRVRLDIGVDRQDPVCLWIGLTIGFTLAALATTLNFDLAKLITPPPREIWLGPFVCAVVSVYLAWRLAKEMRTADNEGAIQAS